MSRVCEEHFALDLADLKRRGLLLPGPTPRRLPRLNVREFEYRPARGGYGYVGVMITSWVSASLARIGDTFRVHVSEGTTDRCAPRRSTHTLSVFEAENAIGGKRLWLCCPDCGGKVRVLYYRRGFRCRTCADLKHRSTVTFKTQRMMERAKEIRRELGGEADGYFQPLPPRPRYMRRRRYSELQAEYVKLRVALGCDPADALRYAALGERP